MATHSEVLYESHGRWQPEGVSHRGHTGVLLGMRIVAGSSYRGCRFDFLDLSSMTNTGTFKDFVASVTLDRLEAQGVTDLVAQSSGNTANSFAVLGAQRGMRSLIFVPAASRVKIMLAAGGAISKVTPVDANEVEIKSVLPEIASHLDVAQVPTFHDQLAGNQSRAHFVRSAQDATGIVWDWHVQALSSAYGPLGFYEGWKPSWGRVPSFLGVQQEFPSPYFDNHFGVPSRPVRSLEPTLFRQTLPTDLVKRMDRIISDFGGTLIRVSNDEYLAGEAGAAMSLSDVGLVPKFRSDLGIIHERAPLYSFLGFQHAVDSGVVATGSRVLIVVTGGLQNHQYYGPREIEVVGLQDMVRVARRFFTS